MTSSRKSPEITALGKFSGHSGACFLKAALIVLAGWWVFLPAFHGGWLWDDASQIIENPLLRDPSGLWKIWADPVGPDYFPLKTTAQWVQWRLWQDHTFGYHVTNVALHLLSALLLWHLFRKLGLRLAWLGGLLFAIHPVVVESVAWIAELKNTLSLPPLLLAMSAWLDYDGRRRRADYVRALLLFLTAMLCKSSVVMFPVVLLLYAWWKRRRITGADLKASAAFFVSSLGLGLVTVWFQHYRAIGSEIIPLGGSGPRLACAGLAIGFYFFKCIFPVGLLPIYPRWAVDPPSVAQWLPWLLLGGALWGLWAKRAKWGRHALFGCGCFLVNLAPVLGFITMAYLRITWVADHFVYLPLVGLAGLAAAGAGTVESRLTARLRPYALGGAVMILGWLAFQSHRYAGIFCGEECFWTYAVQRNPGAWPAHNNLGHALFQAGRVPEAISHYEEALRLKPDYVEAVEAHYNLGVALAQAGRKSEAIVHYEKALRLKPGYAEAQNNLGSALFQTGRTTEAIGRYEEALRLKPDYAEAHYNLGVALAQAGRKTEALEHYEQALRLKPDYAEAHYNWGNALLSLGRKAGAIRHYQEALRIKPGYAEAHNNLGTALFQTGRTSEAIRQFEEALRLKPANAEARNNLARLRAFQQTGGTGN